MGGKPAQAHGGEGVANGVQPIHPRPFQREDAGNRDHRIRHPEIFGGLGDAWRQLAVLDRARCFGDIQLATADAQDGKDGHGQNDDAHAPQPVQFMTPEIDGGWQVVEVGQDRCPCGGEPRHGFEIGVGKGQILQIRHERECGESGHTQPGQHHEDEAVAGLDVFLESAGQPPQDHTDAQGKSHVHHEQHFRAVVGDQGRDDGQKIGDAEDNQHHAEDAGQGEQSNHGSGAL